MLAAQALLVLLQVRQVDLDLDPHVDLREADQPHECSEAVVRIGPAVDTHDELAAPPQQFVGGEVLEVPAVGDVHVGAAVVEAADRLAHHLEGARAAPEQQPLEAGGLDRTKLGFGSQ